MPCLRRRSYAGGMSDPPLSREEIYAAAEVHDELGPEYSDVVVASFLKRVDKEIEARVDARVDARLAACASQHRQPNETTFARC